MLNLNQVVQVRDIKAEGHITFDLSDGSSTTVHGQEIVQRIIMLLTEYSVTPEGTTLAEFFQKEIADYSCGDNKKDLRRAGELAESTVL